MRALANVQGEAGAKSAGMRGKGADGPKPPGPVPRDEDRGQQVRSDSGS